MIKIENINSIDKSFVEDFLGKATTIYLGEAAGSEKLYVNIDKVSPGFKSTKYHCHTKQEEFFLILSGSGILRMDDEEYAVKKGDFIAKPGGSNISHQFINNGSEILEILDVGTNEEGDVTYYPDEGVMYLRDQRLAFKKKDKIEGWSSEPNENE